MAPATVIALLASLAYAEPLPEPVKPEPVADECPSVAAIVPGEPLPDWLHRDGVALCGATLLPTSEAAHTLDRIAWGEATDRMYRLDVAQWDRDRAWYTLRLEAAEEPPPWHQRPGPARTLGVIEGAGAVLLGAWAISQTGGTK